MSLLGLPNELILDISKDLPPKELNHLILSNRRCALLLTPALHRLALQDVDGLTGLKWAVTHEHESLVQLLLQMGVDVNDTGRDPAGETALHIAVKVPSSLDLARFLLENRANVDEEDNHYNTPLYIASCLANEPAMRLLLDCGADPMGGKTLPSHYARATPFHRAAEGCGASIIALMIQMGGDLETEDEFGNQPLHSAIIAGQEPVVRLLLVEHEVTPDPKALRKALENCNTDPERKIIKLLLKHGAGFAGQGPMGRFPLHFAKEPDIVALLVENGAPINTLDIEGRNALHHKIWQLKDVIERLYCLPLTEEEIVVKAKDFCKVHLENGADINVKDRNGKTVLDTATEINLPRVREALLKLFLNHLENI